MNMADEAARSIGANVLLVRAGAMYHDIGKMMNPLCFVENSAPGVNYHANLSPKDSATEIIRHVQDGVALADKHGLPSVVRSLLLPIMVQLLQGISTISISMRVVVRMM